MSICYLRSHRDYWFHVPLRSFLPFSSVRQVSHRCAVVCFFISYSQESFAASQIGAHQFFPILLSGFLFSIEQMPVALQWITRSCPTLYVSVHEALQNGKSDNIRSAVVLEGASKL